MGEAAWPYHCLAPQLVPSWTPSERNFEQCSPSPAATAATGPCTHRKSQEATIRLLGERNNIIHRQCSMRKRARLGASWVGRVKRSRAVGDQSASRPRAVTSKLGRCIYSSFDARTMELIQSTLSRTNPHLLGKKGNERAWRDHCISERRTVLAKSDTASLEHQASIWEREGAE